MAPLCVLPTTPGRLADAVALVFEYMAGTQEECGRLVPSCVDELPEVLRVECADLAATYRPPGALLLAYREDEPVGCVGVRPTDPAGTVEVKRLYVRPAHRRGGAARLLMDHAHRHAAAHGFTRLVLDVMPGRVHVTGFYRRLGYTDSAPYPAASTYPMIYLQRPVTPGGR